MIELQLLLATLSAWANRRQGSVIAYLVVSEKSNPLYRYELPPV